MRVCVIAAMPEYAAAPMLAESIRHCGHHVDEWYGKDSSYATFLNTHNIVTEIDGYDKLIFCGGKTFDKFVGSKKYSHSLYFGATIILTDSFSLKEKRYMKKLIEKYECGVFAMPGIMAHYGCKPFHHAINLPKIQEKKYGGVVVSHSPGLKMNGNTKGTQRIMKACIEAGLPIDVIAGAEWVDCLKRKAKTEIFVDHVIKRNYERFGASGYCGDIGKSGLEAMLLGNLVITSGELSKTEPFIPSCPVVICKPMTLAKTLVHYANDEDARKRKIEEQQEWAKKYTGEFVGKYIMGDL